MYVDAGLLRLVDAGFTEWLGELKKNFDNFKDDTFIPNTFLERLRKDYDEDKTSDDVASSINEEFKKWFNELKDEFINFPDPIPPPLMEKLISYFMRGNDAETVAEFLHQDKTISDLEPSKGDREEHDGGGYIRKKYKRRKTPKVKRTKRKSRRKRKSHGKRKSRRTRRR